MFTLFSFHEKKNKQNDLIYLAKSLRDSPIFFRPIHPPRSLFTGSDLECNPRSRLLAVRLSLVFLSK